LRRTKKTGGTTEDEGTGLVKTARDRPQGLEDRKNTRRTGSKNNGGRAIKTEDLGAG